MLLHVELLTHHRITGGTGGEYHREQFVHPLVYQLLADFAGLHCLHQLLPGVAAAGGHFQMGACPDTLHIVVGGAPVGDHKALKAPLIPEDVLQKMLVFVGIDPVNPIVGGHNALGVGLLHHDFKAGEVDFPEGALVHDGVGGLTAQLGIVGGKVLGAGGHTLRLNAPDVACGHFTCQIGVFTEILEVTAAQG